MTILPWRFVGDDRHPSRHTARLFLAGDRKRICARRRVVGIRKEHKAIEREDSEESIRKYVHGSPTVRHLVSAAPKPLTQEVAVS